MVTATGLWRLLLPYSLAMRRRILVSSHSMTFGDQAIDLKTRKDELRIEARRRRASIPSNARQQAAAALARHSAELPLTAGQIVGIYRPIGTELDTVPLLHQLHATGYQVALPRTVGAASALRFYLWKPGQALGTDLLGFPTPIGTEEVTPDILLVPLVAFDTTGNRLGQGAGFYDRTLSALRRSAPNLLAIGIAFACQRFEELPVALHDQPLSGILTENGYINLGAPAPTPL